MYDLPHILHPASQLVQMKTALAQQGLQTES